MATEVNNWTFLSRYCINIEIYVCNNISLVLSNIYRKSIKSNVNITKGTDHKVCSEGKIKIKKKKTLLIIFFIYITVLDLNN